MRTPGPLPFLALTSCLLAGPAGAQDSRQVVAPPSDILAGVVRLPDARARAQRSGVALRRVEFDAASSTFEAWIPNPTPNAPWSAAAAGFDAGAWTLGGSRVDGAEFERARLDGLLSGAHAVGLRQPGGGTARRHLRIDAPPQRTSRGVLAAGDAARSVLVTWLATPERLADRPFELVAKVEDGVLEHGEVELETDRGTTRIELLDDGLHADGAAADGVFGATLPAGLSGPVLAWVRVLGRTPDGARVERGAVHSFHVVEPAWALSGTHAVHANAARASLDIELGAWRLIDGAAVQVSAEVWGVDPSGASVPIAWLSRILRPAGGDASQALDLELEHRLLADAGAGAPLELRHVRLQDPDTHVVFEGAPHIPLETAHLGPDALASGAGAPGPSVTARPPAERKRSLLLVHGYCSDGAPWPVADFSAPRRVFVDPDANRSHDAFALLIRQRTADLFSFGVVAHSQGGMAALHLATYYPSGLARAEGARLIQSLGSPYQGTPLASFGGIPGLGCGVNDDMTPDGSALWLAGIPSARRAEVFYTSTSPSSGNCNFFTNLVLSSPNDGVVEESRAVLPGGNFVEHVSGWCHTTGMNQPAQYTDHPRNAQRDANAAR